jgi:ABC-type transport system substrate-binding protein
MYRGLCAFTAAALMASAFGIVPSFAQKSGGILRVHAIDSPPSLSMHEEIDAVPARATMVIFNNLVMFDQHVKQNSIKSVVPDLATGWSWNEDGTELTFPLRQGVRWHDGKPFTAADVKCTWDLLLAHRDIAGFRHQLADQLAAHAAAAAGDYRSPPSEFGHVHLPCFLGPIEIRPIAYLFAGWGSAA